MRARAPVRAALVASALAAAGAAAPARPADGVSGLPPGRTTWSGTVLVAGDVEVPADALLAVEPGTRVVIASKDASASGWNRERVEIHVRGGITVAGTAGSPVVFEVDGLPPPPWDAPSPTPGDAAISCWRPARCRTV